MKIILAADMHLKPGSNIQQNNVLKAFLARCADAQRLILLGDTFNCWFEKNGKYTGDYQEVIDLFCQSVQAGLEIVLINGNRDFAFSRGYMTTAGYQYAGFQIPSDSEHSVIAKAGIKLHGWNYEFEQDGVTYHCSHGDMYCIKNIWHQLLRYLIMGNPARMASYIIPRFMVHAVFKLFRAYERNSQNNHHVIFDYNLMQDEALAPIIDSGADHIVCGHLHQYSTRKVFGKKRAGRITVLPCWAGGEYGILENNQLRIKNISCG